MDIKFTVWIIIMVLFTGLLYYKIGFIKIWDVLKELSKNEYWKPLYNKVEFLSWMSKIGIIVPGLIFGIEIWQLHIIALITSSILIWVKTEKRLPTLILFNTIWVGISSWFLIKNILMLFGY